MLGGRLYEQIDQNKPIEKIVFIGANGVIKATARMKRKETNYKREEK